MEAKEWARGNHVLSSLLDERRRSPELGEQKMSEGMTIRFGIPEEWTHFGEHHQLFLDRFPNLRAAMHAAFLREVRASEPVDRIVFFAGRLCVEEFMEILLLCGNGYGIAALKIVRGMFERVITALYLRLHPKDTDDFLDFHWVSQRKLARAIESSFGKEVLEGKLEEVEANYQRVRGRFMVTDCKRCGTRRLNFTWSKLDLVAMARNVGTIGALIVPAYYLPTREAHSTVGAILSRLKENSDGVLTFDEGPQREKADEALISAHNLLLNVLELQREHFKLQALKEPLGRCYEDFLDIWGRPKKREK